MTDYKDIQEKFNEVIKYSQGITKVNSDDLFKNWQVNKAWFIEKFGGLIYKCEDNIKISVPDKVKNRFFTEYLDYLESICPYKEFISLRSFLIVQGTEAFLSNKVIEDYQYDSEKIKSGLKMTKALKYFISSPEVLNLGQIKASQYIQKLKINGTLYLSVHPLDFLSLSESTYCWRSCHALDGDYRAGNLDYMGDESTVIAYIGTSENKLPNFPFDWIDKHWRRLLFISDDKDSIIGGRQYPFDLPENEKLLTKYLSKIFDKEYSYDWEQTDQERLFKNDNNEHIPLSCLIDANTNSLYFNDILSSSFYLPSYTKAKNTSHLRKAAFPVFKIGQNTKCLQCGEEKIYSSEYMRCFNCELAYGDTDDDNFGTCSCCGSRIGLSEKFVTYIDDLLLCNSCVDLYAKKCDKCGELFMEEDLKYNELTGELVCRLCYHDTHF